MKPITRRIGAVSVLLSMLLIAGCGYPEVSPQTYELAKALYSVSNLKRTDGLEKVESMLAESLQTGEITDSEAGYLREIVQQCRDGEWGDAQQNCRRLMEDQVGARPASQTHQH